MKDYRNETIMLLKNVYQQLKENRTQVDSLIEQWNKDQKQGKSIIIFGAGVAGRSDVYSILRKWDIRVNYF